MDVIAAQYGWSNDQILNLHLTRLNQVRDAIYIRQYTEMQNRHREIEWQTKTLASFIVSVSPVSDKSRSQLQKVLEKISLSDTSDREEPVSTPVGSDGRSIEDIIENGSVEQALERNGSRNIADLFRS